jgi:predicted Zn-dependent peptidase
MDAHAGKAPAPVAVVVSGKVEPEQALRNPRAAIRTRAPAKLPAAPAGRAAKPKLVRAMISKPLAQGGLGYVVEGPRPGTRDAFVWRMLLYVLTHDYSGRLGNSAIRDRESFYHIYSLLRTGRLAQLGDDFDWGGSRQGRCDGGRASGELTRLVNEPPTADEVEAARNHLLGRDLTAAQNNEELTAKLTRNFVETRRPQIARTASRAARDHHPSGSGRRGAFIRPGHDHPRRRGLTCPLDHGSIVLDALQTLSGKVTSATVISPSDASPSIRR